MGVSFCLSRCGRVFVQSAWLMQYALRISCASAVFAFWGSCGGAVLYVVGPISGGVFCRLLLEACVVLFGAVRVGVVAFSGPSQMDLHPWSGCP